MLWKIQNFGKSTDIFVDGTKYFISRGETWPTNSERLAEEAAKLPYMKVIELYEEMNYFDLLKIAKQRGIEIKKKRIKKRELIEILRKE